MTVAPAESSAAPRGSARSGWWLGIPLAVLWFQLVNHLRLEWTVNPQYTYGWAVPFLSVFLGWRALANFNPTEAGAGKNSAGQPRLWLLTATVLAVLWLPTRLVGEANPDWRMASWAMALVTVGVTLAAVRFGGGGPMLRALAFPVLFFLVAVPWPTVIEAPLVRALTGLNASACIEVLGFIGIPALLHGNVIEISTGVVGIEEACSGIRSFQASLMIALFLGHYYGLRPARRAGLVLAGFALAMFFNLCRTTLLVVVASRQGVDAVANWHDPAGVTILVGCFLGVWAAAAWLKRGTLNLEPRTVNDERSAFGGERPGTKLHWTGAALLVWLVAVELAVATWYRAHERTATAQPQWTVNWPTNAARFHAVPMGETVRQLLRYDEAGNAQWFESDGTRMQVIFLRWNPGRIAAHLARTHTPEVCLTAAGGQLRGSPETREFEVDGQRMRFEVYDFDGLRAYYCLWEDRATQTDSSSVSLTYSARWRAVRAGLRNLGQRSLEIAVWTRAPGADVDARIAARLPELIDMEPARLNHK